MIQWLLKFSSPNPSGKHVPYLRHLRLAASGPLESVRTSQTVLCGKPFADTMHITSQLTCRGKVLEVLPSRSTSVLPSGSLRERRGRALQEKQMALASADHVSS